MSKEHTFSVVVTWNGNRGEGTRTYTAYSRNHILESAGKAPLQCSSAPAFRGDGTLYNPEDMLLYSVASCHMLWFLHCCADAGVIVTGYTDRPSGILKIDEHGIGRFTGLVLHPEVTLANAEDNIQLSMLHAEAHKHCFIANTLNCPVVIEH
ncbi:MAG: OsmC family protein [Bacteroidota bacterium]